MARTYRRDSKGRFSSGGGSSRGVKAVTASKLGSRLGGGKPTDMKFGRMKPVTSAPIGTVAKDFYNRRMGKVFGYGKVSKFKAAPAAKAKAAAAKRGLNLGSKRPGTSAPKGTIPKRMVDRSMGAIMGQGGATKVKPAAKTKAKPAKMSKAAPNKAKAAYKAATSKAREARMLAGGRTSTRGLGNRTDAGAQRIRASVRAAQAAAAKVRAMEKRRGVSGRKRAKKK